MNIWKKALLLVSNHLIIIITALAQNQVQPIVEVAAIPEKTQLMVHDTLDVVIQIQAGAQQVVGATAHLKYDPSLFQVLSLLPGHTLETKISSKFDNENGRVIYSAGTLGSPPTGTFDFLIIRFKVLDTPQTTSLSFETSTGNAEKTDVAFYDAISVLRTTHPATVTILANNPPTAHAGTDVTLVDTDGDGKEKVLLDGSASKDSDGEITSYVWRAGGKEIARGIRPEIYFNKGQTKVTLIVTDNLGATGTDEVIITLNEPDNKAPVAKAGEDQILTDSDGNGKEEVQLNGSNSSDEDGSIMSYRWSIEDEDAASGAEAAIELPVGITIITLTVTDDKGLSSIDDITITVNSRPNQAPIANAGEDIFMTDENEDGFEEVQLDGSGSKDHDGTIVGHRWKWGLGNATGQQPIVKLPHGEHKIALTVTDNNGATATDTVMVMISPPIRLPQAYAGEDIFVEDKNKDGKEEVVLDGSGSTRGSHNIASYTWATEEEEIATGMQPTVELPVGVTMISLTVTDSQGATSKDEVKVTITAPEYVNITPIAHAGDDQTLIDEDKDGEAEIQLDGSVSKDEDGIIEAYVWTYTGLNEPIVGIRPNLSLPLGTTDLILTVTDDRGATAKDTVSITVELKNEKPVAHAGEDQEVIDADGNGKEEVVLDGSGSKDQDGSITNFEWYSNKGQKIATGKTASVTLGIGVAKIYLVVTDNQGDQDTTSVMKSVITPLGMDEAQKKLADIIVFPNPTGSYFTISSPAYNALNFYMINDQGKIVSKGKIHKGRATFDVTQYPKGTYFLSIEAEGKRLTQKLIVQ